MTRVKICGFRSAEPLLAAIEAGADAVGLVFVPSARRRVSVPQARAMLDAARAAFPAMPEVVGLFADQPADEAREAVAALTLDAVQLCGSEGVGDAREIGAPVVYKAIRIDPETPIAAQMPRVLVLQQRHALAGHRVVVDAGAPGEYGGAGRRFDWSVAASLAEAFPMTLAGGLSPENVGEAIDIVKPWGVDVSSGVETDGEQDPAKIRAFVAAARAAGARKPPGLIARLFGGGG